MASPSSAASPPSAAAAAQTVSGQGIAAKALEVMALAAGKPYAWGGRTTEGFDCSGFVSYVLKQLLPNSANLLSLTVAGFVASGLFDDVSDRQIGDLIIFPAHGSAVDHMGLVCDASHWIGCQSSTGVALVAFGNPYWNARPKRFRRLRAVAPSAVALALLPAARRA